MEEDLMIWVIARVGKYHRCLAVASSILYGRYALLACLRLTETFSDKSNRLPLEAELDLAAEWHKDDEDPVAARYLPMMQRPQNPATCARRVHPPPLADSAIPGPVRFPFISTCLVLAESTVGPPPASLWIPELQRIQFDLHGVVHAFIDITDLDNVRYALMASHRQPDQMVPGLPDKQGGMPASPNQPWCGRQYLQAFLRGFRLQYLEDYQISTTNDTWELADQLSKLDLVDLAAILDVWPWLEIGPHQSPVMRDPDDSSQRQRISHGGPPLWDQALTVFVRDMISSTEPDLESLDELAQIPNFKSSLKRHLITAKDDLCKSPTAPVLLAAAYDGDVFLDWTPFHTLPPAMIMAAALDGPKLQGVASLSICPDWSSIEASELAQAICAFPRPLQHLYLMELPGRSSDSSGHIGEFYAALAAHPRCPRGKILLSGAFSCALRHQLWFPGDKAFSTLPAAYPVLQLIVEHHTPPFETQRHRPAMFRTCSLFLGDGFMTPIRLANVMIRIIERYVQGSGRQDARCEARFEWNSIARLLARAAPIFDDHSALRISSLPAEVVTIGSENQSGRVKTSRMRDLLPGTWTALLHSTRGPTASEDPRTDPSCLFRCAFIRPRNEVVRVGPADPDLFRMEDIEILDMEGFLRATVPGFDMQHANALDRQLQGLERLGVSGSGSPRCIHFSRAPIDSELVCHMLNRASASR